MWLSGMVISACSPVPETVSASPQSGDTLVATVLHVKDGDSLVIRLDGRDIDIRLFGIDAPEKDQPHAVDARRALERLVKRSTLTFSIRDKDRYDRLVAVARSEDHTESINVQLVRLGYAWVYTRYTNDPALLDAEQDARRHNRGLWRQPAAERRPPWEWRNAKRRGGTQ